MTEDANKSAGSLHLHRHQQLQANPLGFQANGIVNPAPLARPAHPGPVHEIHAQFEAAGRRDDADPWDYPA